jgi:hypothetical protein
MPTGHTLWTASMQPDAYVARDSRVYVVPEHAPSDAAPCNVQVLDALTGRELGRLSGQ